MFVSSSIELIIIFYNHLVSAPRTYNSGFMLLLDAACLRCKVSVSLVSGPMTLLVSVKMVPLISQLRKPDPPFFIVQS